MRKNNNKIHNVAIIFTLAIGAWSGLALAVPAIQKITIDQSTTPMWLPSQAQPYVELPHAQPHLPYTSAASIKHY